MYGAVLREGDLIALDGTSGEVTTDDIPLVEAAIAANSAAENARGG